MATCSILPTCLCSRTRRSLYDQSQQTPQFSWTEPTARQLHGNSATKHAFEGWSVALRNEVKSFGVHVIIVEPGAFRTRFHGGSLRAPAIHLPEYDVVLEATRKMLSAYDGTQPGNPIKTAEVLYELSESSEPPLRLVLSSDALDEVDKWEKTSRSTDFT